MKRPRSLVLAFLFALSFGLSCKDWKDFEEKFSGPKKADDWSEPSKKKQPSVPFTVPWKGEAVAADTFIKISKIADPSVVNVGTTKTVKRRRGPNMFGGPDPFEDFFGDDLFRRFFGEPQDGQEDKQQSLGSGFVVSADGYIATNNHVVDKADVITVTIGKDTEYPAKVVGADPKTDVALLKIQPKEALTPMQLGDSDELQVGEIVVAIGNPFGFAHTVTQGIVSAKERSIRFGPYDNFIQTDASINPGNSGGPLLNLRAEAVGINTAIVASANGIGFAIPINLAKNVLSQLRDKGSVTRGWLGVYIQKVDGELAKSLKLTDRHGALVSGVQKGSPAAKVGIRSGDVILKFGAKEIVDYNDLPLIVASTPVGTKVKMVILRDGKKLDLEPTIEELKGEPEEEAEEPGKKEGKPTEPDRLGLSVAPLTPDLARRLGLEPGQKGVVVTGLSSSGPAEDKGIQRGDIILEVNRQKIESVSDYRKYTKSLKKGHTVLLLIRRGAGASLFVAFTL